MIRSLTVKNYRVLEEFSLDQTARVNLVVGTNNSGKSSLLEAIYLLTSENPVSSLLYILSERGEFVSRVGDPRFERRPSGGYVVTHIFHGHSLNKDQAVVIYGNAANQLSLSISVNERRSRDRDIEQQSLFDDENIEVESRSKRLILEQIKPGAEPIRESIPTLDGLVRGYPQRVATPTQKARFITTNVLAYDELALLWDSITLTPREDRVVAALQIVEPRVERISFTSRQSSSSGVLLKLVGENEPIPLSSLGDGVRRVLPVVAALVSVDAGTLLVDEIDTGLHFSVLKDMWRLIFETATRDDSQVFATTHSWDCVRAFQQALHEVTDPSTGRLIRLDRIDGQVTAVGYAAHELDIAIKQGIEVR